jgi:anti-anti-sigma factor
MVGGDVTRMDGEPLLISVEKVPGGTVLVVRGEVDLSTAAQLRDELLRHLVAAEGLWLDLEGVTFMDSSGLHVLIASRRRADLLGTQLVVARASAAVDRVLEVTVTAALFARGAKDVDPSSPAMSLGPSTRAKGRDDRSVTSGVLEGAGHASMTDAPRPRAQKQESSCTTKT